MRSIRVRPKLTYANVVSTLCLFLVLTGGSAFAAKAMIDGRSLRNGTVGTAKLADNAVTSAKVKNGSLEAADLSARARAALEGRAGANGRDGAAGVAGSDGSPDAPAQILAKLLGVDGAGSGLDADTLDGRDAASFATTSQLAAPVPAAIAAAFTPGGLFPQTLPTFLAANTYISIKMPAVYQSGTTYSPGTGAFVVPQRGLYRVDAGVAIDHPTLAGEDFCLVIGVNGSNADETERCAIGIADKSTEVHLSYPVLLDAGDSVLVAAKQTDVQAKGVLRATVAVTWIGPATA